MLIYEWNIDKNICTELLAFIFIQLSLKRTPQTVKPLSHQIYFSALSIGLGLLLCSATPWTKKGTRQNPSARNLSDCSDGISPLPNPIWVLQDSPHLRTSQPKTFNSSRNLWETSERYGWCSSAQFRPLRRSNFGLIGHTVTWPLINRLDNNVFLLLMVDAPWLIA